MVEHNTYMYVLPVLKQHTIRNVLGSGGIAPRIFNLSTT
jgi:hypothetical protein